MARFRALMVSSAVGLLLIAGCFSESNDPFATDRLPGGAEASAASSGRSSIASGPAASSTQSTSGAPVAAGGSRLRADPGGGVAATKATAAEEPMLPGAVVGLPDWATSEAPFDVAAYFSLPASGDNAASLYLDALFEFSPEVALCFSEQERGRREQAAQQRARQLGDLSIQLDNEPSALSTAEVKRLLGELEIGFNKLALAQERPHCVFASGLDLETILCHAQAARSVFRAIRLKTWRDLARGDVDTAIDAVEMGLRLSRDLRPRGATVSQLVSVACDGILCQEVVPQILADRDLKVSQCDRLMALMAEHARGPDPFLQACNSDYVMARELLHNLEHGSGIFDAEYLRGELELESGDPTEVIAALGSGVGEMPGHIHRLRTELAGMGPDRHRDLVKTLGQYYRALSRAAADLEHTDRADFERLDRVLQRESALLFTTIGGASATSGAFRRHKALQGGSLCLVALRRWAIDKGPPPESLEAVVRAAGLANVPVDPYSGNSLRMARRGAMPVVYSIGMDGRDDGAARAWDFNPSRPEGDIIFEPTWN